MSVLLAMERLVDNDDPQKMSMAWTSSCLLLRRGQETGGEMYSQHDTWSH